MENEDWSKLIPIRIPVDWEYIDEPGIYPDIEGVTGRNVVLLIEKKFTKFERLLAKVLRAPKIVRRTMHHTQSMLWELIDGNRNFEEICTIMESLYHEDISPVDERVKAYLEIFINLRVVKVFKTKEVV
ncbi:MAG: hypothetical protein QGI21_03185 [Candidatus Poseidoniaceae archaeon]|jgi:hypothetical protein|nr:hypothetical protein [Candidatus Poseidoniaceae archaeon]